MATANRHLVRGTRSCHVTLRRKLVACQRDGTSDCHELGTTDAAGWWSRHSPCWSIGSALAVPGCGPSSTAVGLPFDDEFVAGGHEPVDGGLGQQRVAHDHPNGARLEVTRAGLLMPFDDQLVEVRRLGGVRMACSARSSRMRTGLKPVSGSWQGDEVSPLCYGLPSSRSFVSCRRRRSGRGFNVAFSTRS